MEKRHILVVEDEQILACELRDWLESEGYITEIVGDVSRAIRRLSSSPPIDLITLDLKLGTDHGRALARYVQDHYPTTPLIVITGVADTDEQLKCFDEGATDYLVKPCLRAEVVVRVRNVLRRTLRHQ